MRIILVLLLLVINVYGHDWYVATSGTTNGAGTIVDPMDIGKCLGASSPASAGDTILLRGGIYPVGNSFSMLVSGSSNAPITIRSYLNERSIMDGSVTSYGNYQDLIGFEIMNSASINRTNSSDTLGPGLNLNGLGSRAINLIIHDTGAPGIWWPSSAGGDRTEIYGCVIWGCGLYQTNGGYSGSARGPNIYTQNNSGTRLISGNVVFKSWTEGIKEYGEGSGAEGYIVSSNVTFINNMDGYLIDTTALAVTNFSMLGNVSYLNAYDRVGVTELERKNASLSGNTFVSDSAPYHIQFRLHGWTNVVMSNNWFVETTTDRSGANNGADTMVFWQMYLTNAGSSYSVDYNSYFNGTDIYGHWYTNDTGRMQFSNVQTLGYDTHGTNIDNSFPSINQTFLITNKYQPGRATICILNWMSNSTAGIDISGCGLKNGQSFYVKDIQDWNGTDVINGIYSPSSSTITLPLTRTNVTSLIGQQSHFTRDPNIHTDSTFNIFALVPNFSVGSKIEYMKTDFIKGK